MPNVRKRARVSSAKPVRRVYGPRRGPLTSRRNPRPSRSLGALGFPKMLKVKHRYVGAPVQLNCVAGTMGTYIWSANSLYDPDYTSSGHQPMYFDQMSLIYNHYVVIAAKITLRIQTSEDPLGPMIGCLWIDDNATTTATSISHVAEFGKNPIKNFGGPNTDPNTMFSRKWSAKKTFGAGTLANNSLQGTAGGDPTEVSYFKFSYNTVDATSATIYITAVLEQVAVWKELKEIAQS